MNMEKSIKGSFAERGLRFLRNVHLAIGAVALGFGAVAFGAYEFINAGFHEVARRFVENRQAKKLGSSAVVAAH